MPDTLPRTFDAVTCPECRERLAESHPALQDDKGAAPGALASPSLGHQFVFCSDGRYAVCALRCVR